MLLSPLLCHESLSQLVESGPHTALLASPHGSVVASARRPEGERDETNDDDDEEEEEEEEDEGPWLDEPERMRLLLGLASQWTTDESPRIECELGRLYIRSIPLAPEETLPANSGVPSIRSPYIGNFLLVLNGSSETPWTVLADKV
ncbi:hypothetical protein BD324DRAFT_327969 [Kockovaella imperatae]|uniref:Uncharacterized protein n=1 Tax=Kockovaella imperatae TaxID=4999 RepID=A0A1Y1UPI7_9TREE|nr:hypothetical protein BD324DRAFT_327969 [Kockovaella imperatae]ORX39376.1 hypothetical protein BD324DRAFT_327969 [Kockovaella imperatae]